jgi:hypothetical protein
MAAIFILFLFWGGKALVQSVRLLRTEYGEKDLVGYLQYLITPYVRT